MAQWNSRATLGRRACGGAHTTMIRVLRWSRAAVMAGAALSTAALPADPPSPGPSPSPSPSPSASPSPRLSAIPSSPRPISGSVDRVVGKMEEQKKDPCVEAREKGVPCFPVETTIKGEEVSVRESLRTYDPNKDPRPPGGGPGVQDMKAHRPGYTPGTVPIPLVKFDPGCVGKSALKRLKGKNDVYYLYRMRDSQGTRVAMYDRRLEASTFQGELAFLGKFDGECDARAAYLRELLKESPRPSPRPTASPSPRASPR
jgi:hypothetical protein